MSLPRPFSMVRTPDQWRRAAFEGTALIGDVVQLAWSEEAAAHEPTGPPLPPEGMAFDAHCRLYWTLRAEGRVQRVLWAAGTSAQPVDFLEPPEPTLLGDFAAVPGSPGVFEPRALAVDPGERLFVGDGRAIHVFDLWSGRLLRTIPAGGVVVDLAVRGTEVLVLLAAPARLVSLDARTGPREMELPAGVADPSRLAVSGAGDILVLDTERILWRGQASIAAPRATDIEFQTDDILVVARWPGQDFRRFHLSPSAVEEIGALKAKDYDGRGIVRTPDGRIGFRTAKGFRHAVGARLRYERTGRVTTFRLDSGTYQSVWGRVFLDACIPRETEIRIHCSAADEPPEEPTLARTPPANATSLVVPRPDLSPPMPPLSFVPGEDEVRQTIHRRETGQEMPWVPRAAGDRFETYEAPVLAEAGRFLWVTLELEGNSLFTPQVRAVRAEHASHDLMRRLPKVYAREDEASGFLRRYLATFDGALAEWDARSFARRALVDPRSAPAGMLPWLGGFVGLLTDERWPEAVKRQLIEEAVWLFRFRGTVPGLKRFLEIYLGRPVIFIEKFRTRGLGGALVGGSSALAANSILGAGFRIGGAVGSEEAQVLEGNVEDAFATHAHRFTVVIHAALSEEQLSVVDHILEVHRPAHTVVDVCTVGAGMRVGRGLHVALSSMIGSAGGFRTIRLAGSLLGRGGILGRPEAGTHLNAGRLGKDTRVG